MTTHETARNVVPADDEWFDLKVGNDVKPVKIANLGYVSSLEVAEENADAMGYRLVGGQQVRDSFKARFPKPDDKGPVAFGGSQSQNPRGIADVTYLSAFEGKWRSGFGWSGHVFGGYWRWLVTLKHLQT